MLTFTKLSAFGALLLSVAACDPGAADVSSGSDALRGERLDAGRSEDGRGSVFKLDVLTGVPRPYTGATNAIRGVPGGGLPWVVGHGEAKLDRDGTLKVEVEGLVFDPNDATVIERGLANRNTVAEFRAILSCQTVVEGAATVVNLSTAPVPATIGLASEGGGNAQIKETLAVPTPCIAPIVFVTSPTGSWFAASGF